MIKNKYLIGETIKASKTMMGHFMAKKNVVWSDNKTQSQAI